MIILRRTRGKLYYNINSAQPRLNFCVLSNIRYKKKRICDENLAPGGFCGEKKFTFHILNLLSLDKLASFRN